jgi:hypothetical protein
MPGQKFYQKKSTKIEIFQKKSDPPRSINPEFLINRLFGAIPGFLGTVGVFFYQKFAIFSKFLAGNSRRFHGFHGVFFNILKINKISSPETPVFSPERYGKNVKKNRKNTVFVTENMY